jgi:hypothetical protein
MSEPLALRATIPATESAIKVGGGAGDSARIALDLFPEDLDQLQRLFTLRGKRLYVVLSEQPPDDPGHLAPVAPLDLSR